MSDPNKALTKEEQLDILNAFFNRILGEGKEPKAISEGEEPNTIDEGMLVEGIDDIYDYLTAGKGKTLLIEDPQEAGAYHKIQFGDKGVFIT
ncbi:MAG: hypothetical protein IKG76_02610, partial [Firmicutes bacterium]|nr:hypothetical protein [Bacillota bacterium]